MSDERRIVATYRVQLHPGFTFNDVAQASDYLAALGITHVYCSPYLQAVPGSMHGYDVVDPTSFNEELGGPDAFERMVVALRAVGLGHIVDVVPNHMAASHKNRWWWDVLKHGPASRFADWFDIDWSANEGKLMLGLLADPLEDVLERGEISRDHSDGDAVLRYFDHLLPLAPGTETEMDLSALLGGQHYTLVDWRYALRNLNYRRFFEISDLVGLNMGSPEAYRAIHTLVLENIAAGKVDGLRIDHIDGLRDPGGYLRSLRESAPNAYLVVEKVLTGEEEIPSSWPIEGTTGYDFLNLVLGLFVAPAGEAALTDLYHSFTASDTSPEELAWTKKLYALRFLLPADIGLLAARLQRIFEARGWDADEDVLRVAVAETIAGLDVYRTYVSPRGDVGETDRRKLETALDKARRRSFLDADVFDHLREVLLHASEFDESLDFVQRLQQITGSVMAKGIEDTFYYVYNRFVALNEVGGDPTRFGVDPDAFHACAQRAARGSSRSMLATSTHDTKRSEDVRARLALLSEIPDRWAEAVCRWSELAEPHRDGDAPGANAEYLLWQTLAGAWPLSAPRAVAYMLKAAREAKMRTSWLNPDESYEERLSHFVSGVLADERLVGAVTDFVTPLIEPGHVNSLAQTAIKLTYPGVPDVYQGCELWDLSLVDPDNRRPVDYEARRTLLEKALTSSAEDAWLDRKEGLPKMFLTTRALRLRQRQPETFTDGRYEPLYVHGEKAGHAFGFVRGDRVVVLVPRLVMTLGRGWPDTAVRLPEGDWTSELTGATFRGGSIPVKSLLEAFPVALLSRR